MVRSAVSHASSKGQSPSCRCGRAWLPAATSWVMKRNAASISGSGCLRSAPVRTDALNQLLLGVVRGHACWERTPVPQSRTPLLQRGARHDGMIFTRSCVRLPALSLTCSAELRTSKGLPAGMNVRRSTISFMLGLLPTSSVRQSCVSKAGSN